MNVRTAYGTVYGIENIEEAQQILAKTELERDHEGCPECRGMLSLDACIANARAELRGLSIRRADEARIGNYTAREIALVARIDAWIAVQPPVADPLRDTATLLGADA